MAQGSPISIALSADLVRMILADWLNAHLFLIPHDVIDIDCIDPIAFNLGLAERIQAAPQNAFAVESGASDAGQWSYPNVTGL